MSLLDKCFAQLICDFSPYHTTLEEKLSAILSHSAQTINYYKRLLAATGIWKEGKVCLESFADLPVSDRQIINSHLVDLLSSKPKGKSYWNSSGGSTGEPVKILQDSFYLKQARSVTYYQKNKVGYRFPDSIIKFWGDEREIKYGKAQFGERARRLLKNEQIINTFNLTEEGMKQALQQIRQVKPRLIVGYVQSLYAFAGYLERESSSIPAPRAVICSAGVCWPFMRAKIEKTFGATVYNRYGSREVGNIACEEPGKTGLRIAPTVFVEVETESGITKSGFGNLLVTSLSNYAMPLIRYRIGDIGTLAEDSSGSFLKDIKGRIVDLFKTRRGALVDGEYFTHLLYSKPWLKSFQCIQEDYDRIVFNLNSYQTPDRAEENRITLEVKKVMGDNCEVLFNYCDFIADPVHGKFRYCISKVV